MVNLMGGCAAPVDVGANCALRVWWPITGPRPPVASRQ
ncbi:Uncharacterised protein [Nocardia otitidiscaviarum]|uniref:Uncharacterized protein n=1 Tax=Nocardia otitidiscaviarum TaxID=1823 RepID=A0A378YBN7_9NOCA|nr:Uncharacterised protein [Nocardia otitidiscaviarum]